MFISAFYVSASSFSVSGDFTSSYPEGRRIQLYQGTYGNTVVDAASAVYDATSLKTTVVVTGGTVRTTIYRVGLGPGYVDRTNQTGNEPQHLHTASWDGGYMAASQHTDEIIDNLVAYPFASDFDGNDILGMNSGGTAFEGKTVSGTAKRVTVTHGVGTITLSGPQDFDTVDSPTFAGITLTGLAGLLEAGAGGALVDIPGVSGDIVYHSGTSFATLAKGTNGEVLQLVSGLPSWERTELVRWRGAWVDLTQYYVGDVVNHESHLYCAILDHTSSEAADEPGTGVYWEDSWDLML